ncbi:MAG: hypothetical protein MRY83_18875 [Flavobacteriales bacterium]|nr:hypothetical protein [Flavobacteriales bacterium]
MNSEETANKAVIAHNRRLLKEKLEGFHQEMEENDVGQSNSVVKWWVAAAVLVLIGTSIFLYQNSEHSTDALYVSYYEPYEAMTTRSSNGLWDQALSAYSAKEYAKAIELFNRLDSVSYLSSFYLGNAYLASDYEEKAIQQFEISKKLNPAFESEVNWYLALVYLKSNDLEKTRPLLSKVISAGTFKSKDAQKLLQKLDDI